MKQNLQLPVNILKTGMCEMEAGNGNEMETGNENWKLEMLELEMLELETLELETEMEMQPLSCCSPSKTCILLAFSS